VGGSAVPESRTNLMIGSGLVLIGALKKRLAKTERRALWSGFWRDRPAQKIQRRTQRMAKAVAQKQKWFQVTHQTARFPTGMHGQSMAHSVVVMPLSCSP
jgi:hypothetical protein